jgi:hypothetical protein
VPLFHHSKHDADPAAAAAVPDPERYAESLAYWQQLPYHHRAAEMLTLLGKVLDSAGDTFIAGNAVEPLLPDDFRTNMDALTSEQWDTAVELEYTLHDAFQTLVLARLLIRHETEYKGATDVNYKLSRDGKAALEAGNTAEVIARRLPA